MNARLIPTLLLVTSLGAGLAACGRAGAPDTPSRAAQIEARDKGLPVPPTPVPNSQNPDKRFVLDPLLD